MWIFLLCHTLTTLIGDPMVMQRSCVFCQILMGQVEASMVYRDEFVTSFMDIQPLIRGHLLVIPNKHVPSLAELDEPYGAHMFELARNLSQAIRRSGLPSEGVNLYIADGTAAGQTVFHCHLHVIPRFVGDGFKIKFPVGYGTRPPRKELDDLAGKLKYALDLVKEESGGP
jgi:histidine triad (HIT) family protein